MITKAEIRALMMEKRNSMSKEEQLQQSLEINHRLFQLVSYQEAEWLFSFISFRSEVDTKAIIERAFCDRKKVCAPRVEGKHMQFYEIHNLTSLIPSKFGVLEPDESYHKPYEWSNVSTDKLMLLPGLAFDIAGNRIGYGAGYYDRYLDDQKEDGFTTVALAYDFQILNQIPAEAYDMRADFIITPDKIINCNKAHTEISQTLSQ